MHALSNIACKIVQNGICLFPLIRHNIACWQHIGCVRIGGNVYIGTRAGS